MSLFFQFLFFLHWAEQDPNLTWLMKALKYKSISFNELNDLSQLVMETVMVNII